ncbi:PhoX family phosphatase [Tessaracoccus sp. MC1756]|uniref:PhoX family protein n=1 Tax=Tessaracoccus sp. MC1756 TaxID=2760311 RepID=UPI001603CFC7|nr:PhoX family phosphatase [Tessaracoccus sp. MC1756]MBB1508405.1 PhoX family phosphatase [Tessaracoccus sp. MC1756]
MKRLLPMLGHTRGNRSPITCELKCGNACSHPEPNTTENESFRDIVSAVFSRRAALGGAAGITGALVVSHVTAGTAAADNGVLPQGGGKLPFEAIAPVPRSVDTVTVPRGYRWDPIIRWGDPILADAPDFDIENQTGAAQAQQFGYNCDYLNVISDGGNDRSGYLVCNHEYTNEGIMFSDAFRLGNAKEVVDIALAAHGFSVVDLQRDKQGQPWTYVRAGRRNRRITGFTSFSVSGPAAGSDLLKTADDPTGTLVEGTLNNCAGGTTPWGTVLSGEENFNQYFRGDGSAEHARYGIGSGATGRGWETVYPRFDLRNEGYANEGNRFGWVVEIDPEDPTSTPVKHTALGRFKHEAGTCVIAPSGQAVVYSGDDERHDYVYKFVSSRTFIQGDKQHNMRLLEDGTLYVARYHGNSPDAEITGDGDLPADGAFDGYGEWVPLVRGTASLVPGMTAEQVLVFTRLAADRVGATKLDRPEDLETNPVSGKVYLALTNNSRRSAVDEANPLTANRDGHIVEMVEDGNDHAAEKFSWNILMLCGDPRTSTRTYFSGYPADKVSPISCPDNIAFDSLGNLWISTDGQPGTLGLCDALHKVTVDGPNRGRVEQFLAVPSASETCGPVIHDRDDSVFVAVQHPGEDGRWGAHTSLWPDQLPADGPVQVGDKVAAPRPSVVQVTRTSGNRSAKIK